MEQKRLKQYCNFMGCLLQNGHLLPDLGHV